MLWTIFSQGDVVIKFSALVLLAGSLITWGLIVYKSIALRTAEISLSKAPRLFWQAESFEVAAKALVQQDRSGLLTQLLKACIKSTQQQGVARNVPYEERLARELRQPLEAAIAKMEMGMTMLATITSAAPFVGLFGTVWGIYGALVGLAQSNPVGLLEQVSGPIGEALVMTAVGLAVAIPSLIAYNLFARRIRVLRVDLEGFANDLHGFSCHNVHMLSMVQVK